MRSESLGAHRALLLDHSSFVIFIHLNIFGRLWVASAVSMFAIAVLMLLLLPMPPSRSAAAAAVET